MQHAYAEHSSSYPIEADHVAEMERLIKQAEVMTHCLGLVPAALDVSQVHTIFDVACGPGEWVVTMAKQLPQAHVVGIDISRLMIDHAQAWANSQALPNTQFRVMDARGPIAFPDASFDLIHALHPNLGWTLRPLRFCLSSRLFPERERQRSADGGAEDGEVILIREGMETDHKSRSPRERLEPRRQLASAVHRGGAASPASIFRAKLGSSKSSERLFHQINGLEATKVRNDPACLKRTPKVNRPAHQWL